MMIMDKEHFYKVDGEFLVMVSEICQAVADNKVFDLMLASAKVYEKFKNMHIVGINNDD